MDVLIGARPFRSDNELRATPPVLAPITSVGGGYSDETSIVIFSPLTDIILVTHGGFYTGQFPTTNL